MLDIIISLHLYKSHPRSHGMTATRRVEERTPSAAWVHGPLSREGRHRCTLTTTCHQVRQRMRCDFIWSDMCACSMRRKVDCNSWEADVRAHSAFQAIRAQVAHSAIAQQANERSHSQQQATKTDRGCRATSYRYVCLQKVKKGIPTDT